MMWVFKFYIVSLHAPGNLELIKQVFKWLGIAEEILE